LAFEGVGVVEEWNRGYSVYVDGNGRNWGYSTFVLENGDKVFARWDGNAQTVIGTDGAKKSSGIGTSMFNGATGKFQKKKDYTGAPKPSTPPKTLTPASGNVSTGWTNE